MINDLENIKKLGTFKPGQIYVRSRSLKKNDGGTSSLTHYYCIHSVQLVEVPSGAIFGFPGIPEIKICLSLYEITECDGEFDFTIPESARLTTVSVAEIFSVISDAKPYAELPTGEESRVSYDKFLNYLLKDDLRVLNLVAMTNFICLFGILAVNYIQKVL